MSVQYIIIDGPDGVGKSTIINSLVDYFNNCTKYKALRFSPSRTAYGEQIKSIIINNKVSPETELTLQLTTLYQLYYNELSELEEKHNKEDRYIVFIDRWIDSTAVYQKYALMNDRPFVYEFNNPLYRGISRYYILDANDDILDERLYGRNQPTDLYEIKEFQNKVREGYRELKKYNINRTFITVNGSLEENWKKVLADILIHLN